MSAPSIHIGLGMLAEVALEAGLVLGVVQALATQVSRPEQRHTLRAAGVLALPLLAGVSLAGTAPVVEGPGWFSRCGRRASSPASAPCS